MKKNYKIEIENEIVIVRLNEHSTFQNVLNAHKDIGEFENKKLRLWDLSRAEFDASSEQLKEVAEFGKKMFNFPSNVAIVASQDLSFGLLRIFGVYREQDHTEVAVFRTEEEAKEWLNYYKKP